MISSKTIKSHSVIFALLGCMAFADAIAVPRIAVLDFELKDLTLLPGTPAEIARTASVKPLLEEELKKSGYEIVAISPDAQQLASSGVGYLFDHSDAAAQLGRQYNVDYVLVGKLHKPSFLFVYLMAQLVDVKKQQSVGDYISEVKGGEKKLTLKGVESLAVKITDTLGPAK
ncbi:MAG: DUF2380 domain-containing protein [Methylococcaceae bacterium]